eukprot:9489803-Pyramimonas_sp.AAC.1
MPRSCVWQSAWADALLFSCAGMSSSPSSSCCAAAPDSVSARWWPQCSPQYVKSYWVYKLRLIRPWGT